MYTVGKYYFKNSSSIRTQKSFSASGLTQKCVACARSAQLHEIKQNRFKLLNKDRIYYLRSNKYLRGIQSKKEDTPVRILCSAYS